MPWFCVNAVEVEGVADHVGLTLVTYESTHKYFTTEYSMSGYSINTTKEQFSLSNTYTKG